MVWKKLGVIVLFFLFLSQAHTASAQIRRQPTTIPTIEFATVEAQFATGEAAMASLAAEEQKKLDALKKADVTQPEEAAEKAEFIALFAQRPASELTPLNFMAYAVQYAVSVGVPANTIMLVLLLPVLATLVAFVRHVIGIPSIGMLLPIALSITLLSTGITAGVFLLGAIVLGSTLAKLILKKIRIMQLPKMALSMFIVSICIFAVLTASATAGIIAVKQLSIFPVLLLILLSENIVTLQLERSTQETLKLTGITLMLGIAGYLILSWEYLQRLILLYPEFILTLIPVNIIIGRYFGLRLTEYLRFSSINKHGSK